jgi:hypothetical protein
MKEESPKKRRSKRGRESDEDCLEEVIEGDDEGELGNEENCKLFAEFKVRLAGFGNLAIKIRDDPNLTIE